MALELPLPKTIFAHGWWTVNGEKMSKSRGNVVDPYTMVDEFGADAFRYFLLREVPFGHDGDFSRQALIGRINSDLANGLGNLLNRTLTLIERFSHGVIPEPVAAAETDLDKELQRTALSVVNEKLRLAFQLSAKAPVESEQSKLALNQALEAIWGLVQLGNQYIDKTAAWTLAKRPEDRARLHTVLYHAVEALRFLSVALYPFTPETSEEMKRQLGLVLNFSKPLLAGDLQWGGLLPGTKVAKGKALFPRIDITAKTQGEVCVTTPDQQSSDPKEDPTKSVASQVESGTGQISMEDFLKVQLKAAKVLSAERVPKSEKLLKLQVDLGNEQRQIVAGIGKRYEPDQLVGRRVVIVANLKPAKLMGVESQGMVLAAGDHEVGGLVTILEEVDPGTKVK
jgi:methionyl-tRNA synthetase